MLKVYIAILILISPALPLTAQDEPTHTLAELNTLLQSTNSDSVRFNLFLESAMVHVWKPGMQKNDFDSAMLFVKQAMNVPGYLSNPVWQGRCSTVYSQLYREGNQKEKGKSFAENAISILIKHNRKEELANAKMELQNYYNIYSAGELTFKIKCAEEAELLYSESGNKVWTTGRGNG
jgi:hypothetical protein